jgi:integrase
MNDIETASNQTDNTNSIPRHLQYQKARDGRKRQIRGLWVRNGRYYAQMTVKDPTTGIKSVRRIPLEAEENSVKRPVATVAEAVAAQGKLKVQRAENALPVLGQTPKFCDYANNYLTSPTTLNKGPETVKTETVHLNAWIKHLGETRLDDITKPMIAAFRDKRLKEVEPSTVNGAVTVLRNVLKKAIDDGWLKRLPTENLKPLTVIKPKKRLVPMEHMKAICDAALEFKNGAQFKDLILFLCYSGGRISESLRLKWQDVDWTQRHVTIGYDGRVKNYKARVVNFNENLEAHLKDMQSRKAPDSEYLFPSAQRGKKIDKAAKSFDTTRQLVRAKAGLPTFGFHDCRHFFASMCAMSDVAKDVVRDWMGHSTTKLLDDVYVHYCRDYHTIQARKVCFEPIVLQKTA